MKKIVILVSLLILLLAVSAVYADSGGLESGSLDGGSTVEGSDGGIELEPLDPKYPDWNCPLKGTVWDGERPSCKRP